MMSPLTKGCNLIITSLFAVYAVLTSAAAGAIEAQQQQTETLSNIPQTFLQSLGDTDAYSPPDSVEFRVFRF
jgi:hypothetical protein